MNVTRDVITDLLPAYLSGDATADTRALVEQFFRQDPAFEQAVRPGGDGLQALDSAQAVSPDAAVEKGAIRRTRKLLRTQTLLVALASTFTLNAVSLSFSFEIADNHVQVHWLTLPGQWYVVAGLLALAAVSWAAYIVLRRRTGDLRA